MSYLFEMHFRENLFHETTMHGHETTMKTRETSVPMHAPEKNKKCSKLFELVSCFFGIAPEIWVSNSFEHQLHISTTYPWDR